jgi:hypothetical protein
VLNLETCSPALRFLHSLGHTRPDFIEVPRKIVGIHSDIHGKVRSCSVSVSLAETLGDRFFIRTSLGCWRLHVGISGTQRKGPRTNRLLKNEQIWHDLSSAGPFRFVFRFCLVACSS